MGFPKQAEVRIEQVWIHYARRAMPLKFHGVCA